MDICCSAADTTAVTVSEVAASLVSQSLNQSISLILTWPKQRTATSVTTKGRLLAQSAQLKVETVVGQTK